jgi:hypothetical protein
MHRLPLLIMILLRLATTSSNAGPGLTCNAIGAIQLRVRLACTIKSTRRCVA